MLESMSEKFWSIIKNNRVSVKNNGFDPALEIGRRFKVQVVVGIRRQVSQKRVENFPKVYYKPTLSDFVLPRNTNRNSRCSNEEN